jgi:uncharacterized protein (UPF0332 family)
MSLLEKSNENKKVAEKCLDIRAYNAGISRAYYAAFQGVEYVLRNSTEFDYNGFLRAHQIDREHIPHGKMQLAMAKFLLARKGKINMGNVAAYDELYHSRKMADYSSYMYSEPDLVQSLKDMETILGLIT